MAGKTKLEGNNALIALKMLHKITTIMEKHSIPYWLEGGTLLGIVRENRLLPWDNDMDISIFYKDKKKLFFTSILFFLAGYRVSYRKYNADIGPFKKGEFRMIKVRNFVGFLGKGKILLDIFIKKKVENNYYWVVGVKSVVLKSSPAIYLEKQTQIEFNEKKYLVPSDYKGYLTHRYKDWQTPVKVWNFKKDDNAIVKDSLKESK